MVPILMDPTGNKWRRAEHTSSYDIRQKAPRATVQRGWASAQELSTNTHFQLLEPECLHGGDGLGVGPWQMNRN